MTGTPAGAGDDRGGVSEEILLMVARVRAQAASMPTPERLAALADEALSTPGQPMSAEEIRQLAASAIAQARQVSHYLNRLADLLGDGDPGGDP